VDPPEAVAAAFKDVTNAKEDREKLINQSQSYRNDILPKAKGEAAQVVNQAKGYAQARLNRAQGIAHREKPTGSSPRSKNTTRPKTSSASGSILKRWKRSCPISTK